MNEDDVWDLSPTSHSRPVFIKFTTIKYIYFTPSYASMVFDRISGGHHFSVVFSGQTL